MKITAAGFTRAIVSISALLNVSVESKPVLDEQASAAPAETRSVSGAFDLPINHIILGFLLSSTMFSVVGKVQGIASDWFDNTGPSGVSVIKEVQEPHEDYEYDNFGDADEYDKERDEVIFDGNDDDTPSTEDGKVTPHEKSGSNVSESTTEESPKSPPNKPEGKLDVANQSPHASQARHGGNLQTAVITNERGPSALE